MAQPKACKKVCFADRRIKSTNAQQRLRKHAGRSGKMKFSIQSKTWFSVDRDVTCKLEKATAQTAHLFFCQREIPTLKKPKELKFPIARIEYFK